MVGIIQGREGLCNWSYLEGVLPLKILGLSQSGCPTSLLGASLGVFASLRGAGMGSTMGMLLTTLATGWTGAGAERLAPVR